VGRTEGNPRVNHGPIPRNELRLPQRRIPHLMKPMRRLVLFPFN
jgi:hypothetical protein